MDVGVEGPNPLLPRRIVSILYTLEPVSAPVATAYSESWLMSSTTIW